MQMKLFNINITYLVYRVIESVKNGFSYVISVMRDSFVYINFLINIY